MTEEINKFDYYGSLIHTVSIVFDMNVDEVTDALFECKSFDVLFMCMLASKELGMPLIKVVQKRETAEMVMSSCIKEGSKWQTTDKDWN